MSRFSMQDVRAFWDTVADIYERENTKILEIHNQRFFEAVKYIDATGIKGILNIWCRNGEAIPYLRELNPNFNIVNCELSHNMIKIGKEKYPHEYFFECSLHEFPFSGEKFDYVLSLETLEHVPKPILFLKEINRVLKKKGILVMSTPPATAEIVRKIYEMFFTDHGEGPHKFWSSFAVKKMLSESGLRLRLHKGTLILPIGFLGIYKIEKLFNPVFQFPLIREWGIRQFYVATKE